MTLVPFLPPPGLNSDDTTFAKEGRWADSDGFRFVGGRPETIERHAAVSSTSLAAVKKLIAYKISSSVFLAAAGTELSKVALATGTVTAITPASGWTNANGHCLQMWGDELLACNSGGKLFTSVAGAQATLITNAPNQITCMIVTPERQVLALGTKEETSGTFNGRCIRGSNIEDYTDWTTTSSNNAFEHILSGQANIVSGTVLGAYILVWTEDALWLGQFLGNPDQTYRFDKVDGGCGLVGLNAFAVMEGTVYWVSPSLTFHAYQVGGGVSQLPCPISKDFADNAIGGAPSLIVACGVRRRGEVWFSYGDTRDASVGAQCSRYLIYHHNESIAAQTAVWSCGRWSGLLFDAGATDVGHMIDSPLSPSSTGLDVYVATVSGGISNWIFRAQQSTSGPPSTYIQSADQYLDNSQRRMMIKRFTPDFEYQGGAVSVAVSARDRPHSTASTSTYSVATTDKKKDFRKSGMIVSVKFTPATNSRLRLGKPLFDVIPMGER